MSVRVARVKYHRVYQEPPAISDSGIQHPAFPSNDPILRICIRYSIVKVGISKLLFYCLKQMQTFKKSLTGNIFFTLMRLTTFFNVWKIMPETGENKKPIQFPQKIHRSTGTSHFPGNVLFVDKIHRGDQCGCLTFFSNFLGILIRFQGHVN